MKPDTTSVRLENTAATLLDTGYAYLREIRYTIKDDATERYKHLKLVHSRHSMKRSQQRGISRRAIVLALMHGEYAFKQGMVYRIVRDADIPVGLDKKDCELMRHLVVLLNESETEVITCYRNPNGIRHIRRKKKYLYNHREAS